jgi:hypothetical protein
VTWLFPKIHRRGLLSVIGASPRPFSSRTIDDISGPYRDSGKLHPVLNRHPKEVPFGYAFHVAEL